MQQQPYIQVILPLRLDWEPYYLCEAPVGIGDRVAVPFAGRTYIGVVSATGVTPSVAAVKSVLSVETGLEKVLPEEIALWRQMARYYLCTSGEIYRAAHPLGATADEEKAARWRAELERRLEAKETQLPRTRTGTKKEAALREGIARLREQLGADALPRETVRAGSVTETPVAIRVREALSEGRTVLLEERDDAARTAVYLSLATRTLSEGRSVLWLVPDNATLSQVESAVLQAVPEALCLDGRRTAAARRKIAASVRGSGPYLVLGTRAALLLPHHGLALVIVDGEHERAYKQESPAPRYNGRDTALMLARLQGASALIGSATPSLDSLYNVRTGRYVFIRPEEGTAPHEVLLINTTAEKRKRGMDGELSFKLLEAISGQGGRTLVLLPRSGFDPEGQIAGALAARFPGDRRILCSHLGAVSLQDFEDVSLICMLYADALLSRDDFRADERTLQILRTLQFKAPLAIQAKNTDHPVFQALVSGSDGTDILLDERKAFGYPPLKRMIRIVLHDNAPKRLEYLARQLSARLSAAVGEACVSSPYAPARDEDGTVRHIRILLPRDATLEQRKRALVAAVTAFEKETRYAGHIVIDVDPIG